MDFYVIEASDKNSDRVTMLKAEPLTVDEVNTYGVGHINNYTYSSVGTAYNKNGYGGMAYYSSSTCGNAADGNYSSEGCTTDYAQSEVKYVVDAWSNDKLNVSDLAEDNLGYSARLITYDELTTNLGYEKKNEGTIYPSTNGDTPLWVYNSNYYYWTMSPHGDSASDVWRVYNDGRVDINGGVSSDGNVVRPVITLLKSSI